MFSFCESKNSKEDEFEKLLQSLTDKQKKQLTNAGIDIPMKVAIAKLFIENKHLGELQDFTSTDLNIDNIEDFAVKCKYKDIEYFNPNSPEDGGMIYSDLFWFKALDTLGNFSGPILVGDKLAITGCSAELLSKPGELFLACIDETYFPVSHYAWNNKKQRFVEIKANESRPINISKYRYDKVMNEYIDCWDNQYSLYYAWALEEKGYLAFRIAVSNKDAEGFMTKYIKISTGEIFFTALDKEEKIHTECEALKKACKFKL